MIRRFWALFALATTAALLIGLVGAGAAVAHKGKGTQGCTPGYWKQTQHFDSWPSAYSPGDDFDTVFGVDLFSPDRTLLQALKAGGGGADALGRHAVAALLNASPDVPVDYWFGVNGVIATVQAAVSSGDYEGAKDIFAYYNEKGCPLN